MNRILFLTYRMKRGFGVDVVVANLTRELLNRGHEVFIGCLDTDGSYADYDVLYLPPNTRLIRKTAKKLLIDTVVAHTSPYFEILPSLAADFSVFAWEHGDPTPALMPNPDEVKRVKQHKLKFVYPHVANVIAISRFIATDISWKKSIIIWNGCDHVKDYGEKKSTAHSLRGPLKVGALMRLGAGEAAYKGTQLLLELFQELADLPGVECHLMGRGNLNDVAHFVKAGYRIHLNATDAERDAYLRELDIFVSLSQWEGFNLPLVEAQASGTLAIASNAGAHREVTPFVFSTGEQVIELVNHLLRDPPLLTKYSNQCYHFVRKKFKWSRAAKKFEALLISVDASQCADMHQHLGTLFRRYLRCSAILYLIKQVGMKTIIKKLLSRVFAGTKST